MKSVPMNRARALIVLSRPEAYEPTRVHEAATYLSGGARSNAATEEEQRLASDAIAWLRGKRDEPKVDRPAVKPKRKGKA